MHVHQQGISHFHTQTHLHSPMLGQQAGCGQGLDPYLPPVTAHRRRKISGRLLSAAR
jgi:hypothetical protein